MEAFNALRKSMTSRVARRWTKRTPHFRRGDRDAGYAKYREIIEQYYASAAYRNVKRWQAEAKASK